MSSRRGATHPIEEESYRLLAERLDLSALAPGPRAVVSRVVHASADLDYARTMVVDERAVEAGVAALRSGAPILADVEMVRRGIAREDVVCRLEGAPEDPDPWPTRSAAAMAAAATEFPEGAVVVVGCAPSALSAVVELSGGGGFRPALVIGMPVGFVGASAAKEALRASGMASISNVGDKGGSPVAAAAANSLIRLASERGPKR